MEMEVGRLIMYIQHTICISSLWQNIRWEYSMTVQCTVGIDLFNLDAMTRRKHINDLDDKNLPWSRHLHCPSYIEWLVACGNSHQTLSHSWTANLYLLRLGILKYWRNWNFTAQQHKWPDLHFQFYVLFRINRMFVNLLERERKKQAFQLHNVICQQTNVVMEVSKLFLGTLPFDI